MLAGVIHSLAPKTYVRIVHRATHDVTSDTGSDRAASVVRVATWVRLPLQGVLALWAWWYTRPTPGGAR